MRKKEPVVVISTSSGGIDVDAIPQYVAMNLAQTLYKAVARDFQRPDVRADYERWKAERNAATEYEGKD